jgi:hypothetical protein
MAAVVRVYGDREAVWEVIEQDARGGIGAGSPVRVPAGFVGEVLDLGPGTKAWSPDANWVLTFVVDKADRVADGLLAIWLWEKLRGHRVSVERLRRPLGDLTDASVEALDALANIVTAEPVDVSDREAVERLVREAFMSGGHHT